MSNAQITRESLILIFEAKSPQSLTEVYRLLGGKGKLSGSTASRMRKLNPNIDEIVANNKAKAKAEGASKDGTEPKGNQPTLQPSGKPKATKKPSKTSAKSKVPRHPKNPFRPGSGYGLLLDLIANAGSKGIGREDLLKAYCKASGKDLTHAKYDLAVINSAREDSDKRHRSCADSFVILKDGENYRARFQ